MRLLSWSRRARSLDAAGQRAAVHARPGGRAQHRPLAIAVATLVPRRAGRWPAVAGFSPRAPGEGRRPARARAVNSPTQLAHPFCEMSSRARWALLKPVGSGRPCAVVSPRGRRALGASQEVAPAAPQLATASYQTPPQVQALSSIRGDGPDRRAYSMGAHGMGPAGWGGDDDSFDGYLEKFGGRGSGLVSVSGGSSAFGIRSVASVGGFGEPEGGGRAGRGRGASRFLRRRPPSCKYCPWR